MFARPIDVGVADAFEMREDGHARFVLYALHEAFAAARHDDVDGAVEAAQHRADGFAIGRRDELDRGFGESRPRADLRRGKREWRRSNDGFPSRRAGSLRCRL